MMTEKTVQDKVNNAVCAAMNALGLSIEENRDLSIALDTFLSPIAKDLVVDDVVEQPRQYEVQIGRDARVYHSAKVTGTISDIQNNLSRHGYRGDLDSAWKEDGVDEFDNVETFAITDPETDEVVASYSSSDGWSDED